MATAAHKIKDGIFHDKLILVNTRISRCSTKSKVWPDIDLSGSDLPFH